MSHLPEGPGPDLARAHGWDRPVPRLPEDELPAYAGELTWCKRPRITATSELVRRRPDVVVVGVPFDDGVSHRPGARLGPRAIRGATSTNGDYSLALDIEPFRILDVVDVGDVDIIPAWPGRSHAVTYQRMRDFLDSGAVPMVLGGDHSITWPVVSAIAAHAWPARVAMIHFDAHADTADDEQGVRTGHGTPMRRLIESGAIAGPALVQIGLRGYWPPPAVFDWMRAQGMRWHPMTEIEARGIDAVVDDAITEALQHADRIYVSVDIDVVDPGMAPGTGTPEPGGLLARELLRAIRRIALAAPLAGLDVMEVSPPWDHAEVTAMLAHRCVLEAVSGMAVRRREGHDRSTTIDRSALAGVSAP
ncbi:MAG: agmatinase [Chloroflexi bacterium]|nr:agmatinase [Chloroflexota bacterium]